MSPAPEAPMPSIAMPQPDPRVIAKSAGIVAALRAILLLRTR